MPFDLEDPNMAYLKDLPPGVVARAIEADFIDEPMWTKPAAADVAGRIGAARFAITNIYVYGVVQGKPVVPSRAVYDIEIEEFPPDTAWQRIVDESTRRARGFVEGFAFPSSDPLSRAEAAFSFWAFGEPAYRAFQLCSSDDR